MIRTAIIQCPDTGPIESLVIMLRAVGIECCVPSEAVRGHLRSLGHTYVLDPESLVRGMGYERAMRLPEAGPGDMERDDVLYVDIKAHQHYQRFVERWPNLKDRVLWYRINGGKPEHVINQRGDHGDEVNPPCPVLTPNQWYSWLCIGPGEALPLDVCRKSYACYPPFYRADEYYPVRGRVGSPHFPDAPATYAPPVCLIHGIEGWGYRDLIEPLRVLGVQCHGVGAPDGLVNHKRIPELLRRALCMVHLKSSDAPGYALYEALAAGCPVVCTRRLIWRCRMERLLIPGKTCLVFDRETHEGLTAEDVASCTAEVKGHLEALADDETNRRIGLAGRERLLEVMWSEGRAEDVASLRAFLERCYG